jgi:hypothetical protein
MYTTEEQPLWKVLHRARDDFQPEHLDRPPWHQHPSLPPPDWVSTGNLVEVNLMAATRVSLVGLDEPPDRDNRDPLEPYADWRRGPGWGVTP